MKAITSKKALEMVLSRLKGFDKPKVRVEQYQTPSDIAASMLWHSYMKGDLGKVSVDLGCGTGILGIGALLLGCPKVYLVDNDEDALKVCRENLDFMESEGLIKGKYEVIHGDIEDFNEKVEVVYQNPPFGTKVRHADKVFLVKSMNIGSVIYSFHKSETSKFVSKVCEDHGYVIDEKITFDMALKAQFSFHRRKIHRIEVDLFRITKS
jgi:putative methylase